MTEAAAISGARQSPRTNPRVDMDSHIPALFVILGGKIGLHAMRHHARGLGLDLREWRIVQVLGSDGRSTIFAIADRIAMDRGGTSRSVARLEEARAGAAGGRSGGPAPLLCRAHGTRVGRCTTRSPVSRLPAKNAS